MQKMQYTNSLHTSEETIYVILPATKTNMDTQKGCSLRKSSSGFKASGHCWYLFVKFLGCFPVANRKTLPIYRSSKRPTRYASAAS